MKNRKIEAGILGVLLLGLLIFVGYQFMSSNKTTEQMNYSTDLQKLKSDFNADKGKVRLVLLLSPT
jgi:predicted negative regulator of RcsB-dependent stress response